MKLITFVRVIVILCGMALIGIAMFQMPGWFRNWFVGVATVGGTLFLLAHDDSKPKEKP